jgi:hypothetical protein
MHKNCRWNQRLPQQNRSPRKIFWLRGRDLNPRPSGYEPDELPGCSTPHFDDNFDIDVVQIEKAFVRRQRGELAILFAFAAVCDFVDE